jgi:hypothetical protein
VTGAMFDLVEEEILRAALAKVTEDRAKLLIAAKTALVRMRKAGFEDAIAVHLLEAAIKRCEPDHG